MATSDCDGDATTVVVVTELFAVFGSPFVADTLAVLEITVPGVAAKFTLVTRTKLEGEPAEMPRVASVQTIVPVPPTAGIVAPQVHPLGTESETNVEFAGIVSVYVATAVAGPLFVMLWVYVMLFPGSTGFGEEEPVMIKSDCVDAATTTVAIA